MKKNGPVSRSSAVVNGDPRMPSRVKPFKQTEIKAEDLPVDISSLIGIVCGLVGVMMRQKIGCLLAIIFVAQSIANVRSWEHDLKQIMCALTFACMGITTIYLAPVPA